MNAKLMEVVTDLEIKKVVNSVGPTKALGPDGFNDLFYQKH